MMNQLRLVAFDLDGVLTDINSSWQYIHQAYGVNNEENFRRHLSGEIDFREFMRSDICLWKDASISSIKRILDTVPIMKGAQETIQIITERGLTPVIISSGISILAKRIAVGLGINHVYANRLLADGRGRLTGEGEDVVPLGEKDRILQEIARELGLRPQDCIVVGDSCFDIPIFKNAGLSIAFNPRDERVKKAADVTVDGNDLRLLLPWLTPLPPHKASIQLVLNPLEVKAIVVALSPDNVRVPPGLFVKALCRGKTAVIKVVSSKSVETMLATLDDLFACSQLVISIFNIAKIDGGDKTI